MPTRTLSVATPVIAPSMLKCDFADLAGETRRLEQADARMLHWDVMDGHFVPNLSYGAMVINSVRARTDLFFEAHLMISDPETYVDDYIKAGCDAITFHIEAVPDPRPLLTHLRDAGIKAGLALNPGTTVDAVAPFVGLCDLLLVMSVQPGFGGQAFMPEVLPKVRLLRAVAGPRPWISIDGGIGPATISSAAQAGVQLFVAGSSIFDHSDYAHAMRELEGLAAGSGAFAPGRAVVGE